MFRHKLWIQDVRRTLQSSSVLSHPGVYWTKACAASGKFGEPISHPVTANRTASCQKIRILDGGVVYYRQKWEAHSEAECAEWGNRVFVLPTASVEIACATGRRPVVRFWRSRAGEIAIIVALSFAGWALLTAVAYIALKYVL
jgi:hypothetical protein